MAITMTSLDHRLIDQAEEDLVHQPRLLSVEERAFKRITKRLLSRDSLVSEPPTALPTPPPDDISPTEAEQIAIERREDQAADRQSWREDVILDFAAFEASIVRIQFLRNSNATERERYKAERSEILKTAQAIRDNTSHLRNSLTEARANLERKKTYDELAEKITSNRMLRPREDQYAQIEKLTSEISELEAESRDYTRTWAERRDQFGRIVEEGRQMLRLIRDEKEEADRKEGMNSVSDADDGDMAAPRADLSRLGTPRPDDRLVSPLSDPSGVEGAPSILLTVPSEGLNPVTLPQPPRSHELSDQNSDIAMARGTEQQDTQMVEADDTQTTEDSKISADVIANHHVGDVLDKSEMETT